MDRNGAHCKTIAISDIQRLTGRFAMTDFSNLGHYRYLGRKILSQPDQEQNPKKELVGFDFPLDGQANKGEPCPRVHTGKESNKRARTPLVRRAHLPVDTLKPQVSFQAIAQNPKLPKLSLLFHSCFLHPSYLCFSQTYGKETQRSATSG